MGRSGMERRMTNNVQQTEEKRRRTMANKKGDTTRIQAVPDVNKCTNLGCYSMKEREA